MAAAVSLVNSTTTFAGPLHQLRLRLLAVVEQFRSTPPDRGVYREALVLAVGSHKSFSHGGRRVSRRDVLGCGNAIYFFRDAGFTVRGRNIADIAAAMSVPERVARACLGVLQDRYFLAASRPSRRQPAIYEMPLVAWVRGKLDGSSAVHGDRTQPPESGPRGSYREEDVRTEDDQEPDQGSPA